MQKDVIYIDVEDDITAIIGKVKASKEKVVALVPPKRVGVLQSAVNLRLLSRAAKQGDKHLALVTNNHSLIALASAASIPVAKNLQSKPELADIPALEVDDGEDVIDGGALPVGEHAKQDPSSKTDPERDAAMAAALAEAPKAGETPKKPKSKSGPKVPNFNKFRKKLVFIVGGAILFILFLVWAIFIAPRATVVISAKTSSDSINQPVTLTSTGKTDLGDNTIKAIAQSKEDDKSVDFRATGKKDAGKKATGTVKFSTNDAEFIANGGTIPAGTKLSSSNGLVFTTDSTVKLTLFERSGTTSVTAAENGSKYNAADGSMSGAPDGVSATLTEPTSGGVTKTITVVTAADVQKAKEELASDDDTDSIKNDLKSKFASDDIVIDDSFAISYSDVSSSPDVGEEADDAKLSVHVTYKLYAVEKDELGKFLDAYMKHELEGKTNQRVYKNGSDGASFQEASKAKNGAKATLIATAQVGPKIDDNQIKDRVKGKRFGEIQQDLESVQGVDNVNVKFFPFWVNTVPNDNSRITIEFKLDESK